MANGTDRMLAASVQGGLRASSAKSGRASSVPPRDHASPYRFSRRGDTRDVAAFRRCAELTIAAREPFPTPLRAARMRGQ